MGVSEMGMGAPPCHGHHGLFSTREHDENPLELVIPPRFQARFWLLPSGKHTKNDGKSQFLMGKSTISTGPFSIAMLVYQRIRIWNQ